MKLACNSWSYNKSFVAKKIDLIAWIEMCARGLGVSGVELDSAHIANTAHSALREIVNATADSGLALVSVTAFNDFGHADPGQNQAELDKVCKWLDVTRQLGSPLLRVFAGWPKPVASKEQRWSQMIEHLAQAAQRAEQAGLTLVLENHNHGGFIQTSRDVERALKDVGSRNLKLNLDTGNYLDGMASITKTVRYAAHVHAKLLVLDADGREKNIDHAKVIALLRRVGYRGYVSAEYEGQEDEMQAVPRGVRYLKQLLARS